MTSLAHRSLCLNDNFELSATQRKLITLGGLTAVSIVAVLAHVWPWLASVMEFDRHAISQGQLWRVLTGHITHWNFDHLFWDLATFVGLSIACAQQSIRRTISGIVGSAFAISAGIWLLQPEIHQYRGLSGIDSALFALLAVGIWNDARRRGDRLLRGAAIVGLSGFFAKTGYELLTGQTLFVDSHSAEFIPLASAHVVGATVGGLAGFISKRQAS